MLPLLLPTHVWMVSIDFLYQPSAMFCATDEWTHGLFNKQIFINERFPII